MIARIDRPNSLPYPSISRAPTKSRMPAEYKATSLRPLLPKTILAYRPQASHITTMSHNLPQTSSSANYQVIFDNALGAYKKKTGKDLASDPLLRRLGSCNSPDNVLNVLREQIPGFAQSESRLTTWIKPTINVLYTFSSIIGSAVTLVSIVKVITQDRAITSAFQEYPPGGVIFTGIASLLSVGVCPTTF